MPISDSVHLEQVPLARISDEYRTQVYMQWYGMGKPTAASLWANLQPDALSGIKPSLRVVEGWIRDYFVPAALEIDEQVTDQVDSRLIQVKLEMLDRHAEIGRELQEMGLEYLKAEGIGSAKTALMAVIKGVEIEHNARVLPTDIVRKLENMTDDQLLKEFSELLKDGKILSIEPNTPDESVTT